MKLGISAFAWTASFQKRHFDLLASLRKQGFSAIEIPMFDPSALDTRAIRRTLIANDLASTVCSILPAEINPISPDADTRKRSHIHLKRCIEAASAMGAHVLAGPIYAPIGYLPGHRRQTDEWQWFVEALLAVEDLLDANDVTLAIEPVNRSETHFLRTAQEALGLFDIIPNERIGVTIDTFHANIEEKSTPSALLALGKRLKHIHLSENDRGIIGTGQIDFTLIHRALQAISYDGLLIIEGFGYLPTERSAPGFLWAEQAVSPEDFAQMSFANLQTLILDGSAPNCP
jgi:D-psicose/D-tagatose/L-ribulose 3-epimerase